MGYDDVGKGAKYVGRMHYRHVRKLDAQPERATPLAAKKPKAPKNFGFEYQGRDFIWKKLPNGNSISDGFTEFRWETYFSWYATARQRDQAMQAWKHQHSSDHRREYYGEVRPIERRSFESQN